MSPLRILISGAGVAGPTVAFSLSKLGHSCNIVERHSTLRNFGQQIDLRGQGIVAVERLGLKEVILKHNVDESGFQVVDGQGNRQILFGRMEAGDEKSKAFTSEIEIMRSDLCNLMHNATKQDVDYRFGLTVVDYENQLDGVVVTFSDGSTEKYDLLIAADGSGSRIRRMMLKKDENVKDSSLNLGFFTTYFHLARESKDENIATGCLVPGQRFMMTRWHSEDEGQAYFITRSSKDVLQKALKEGGQATKEAFAQVYDGAGWQASRLIEAMHKADDFYAEEIVQRKSNTWRSGRVVLLGDAAFAPGAVTGMGTSLAVVGAYVLAGEMGRCGDDVLAGLEGYEKTMTPFVQQAQELPPGTWRMMWPKSALGVRMLFMLIRTAVWLRVPTLLSWLESESQWTLPRYEELEKAVGC